MSSNIATYIYCSAVAHQMSLQAHQEKGISTWILGSLYDSRFKYFKGKLQTRWLGPYEVDTLFNNGIVLLVTIDED